MRPYSFRDWLFPPYNLRFESGATFRRAGMVAPGVDGDFDASGQQAVKGPLVFGVSFRVRATDEADLERQLDEMKRIVGKGEYIFKAHVPNGDDRAIFAKCVGINIPYTALWPSVADVRLDFVASFPFWQAADDVWRLDQGQQLDADPALTFDTNYTQRSIASSPDSFTITNSGSAPIRQGRIEIAGVCTDPRISNAANGLWVQYTGSLGSDERLLFDLDAGGAYIFNAGPRANAWANVTLGDKQVEMMRLEVGDNAITVTATSPNCTLTWWWARAYH